MKKGDKFVLSMVVVVFFISIFSMTYYFIKESDSNKLVGEIYRDNKLLYSYDLDNISEPKEIKIHGAHKDEYNIVLIEEGRMRFKESNCRDDVCVHTSWISKKGEMAVCLPHKVYIKIVGEQEDIDGSTF